MLIVADIGNSCAHFGVYTDGQITNHLSLSHTECVRQNDFITRLTMWWDTLPEQESLIAVSMGSVYAPLSSVIHDFFRDKLALFEVKSSLDVGFDVQYTPLTSFGVDRFANLVAFIKRYSAPGIIIDLGSALTVDIVDMNKKFVGGLIYPGPELSSKALHAHTSQLPLVSLDELATCWGKSTHGSIAYGLSSVYTVYIDALISQIKRELNVACITAVATGGWSALWQSHWQQVTHCDIDLTLRGMGDIYVLTHGEKML